ncbi:putative transcription factor Hap3/NF-YB family [Helianthus annuus]|nr:putative transcription factor Hap3/NF-YB family [Helianthus annuus]
MAESDEINTETLQSSFPAGRMKRIMKLDTEINKVNSDALFVISTATDLFLKFLTEKSSEVAIEKKQKTIKLEHLRMAVKRHRPTADFLLDSLPMPPPVQISSKTDRSHKSDEKKKNSLPAGTRGINSFFKKYE